MVYANRGACYIKSVNAIGVGFYENTHYKNGTSCEVQEPRQQAITIIFFLYTIPRTAYALLQNKANDGIK
jgi:hypothetical protein